MMTHRDIHTQEHGEYIVGGGVAVHILCSGELKTAGYKSGVFTTGGDAFGYEGLV